GCFLVVQRQVGHIAETVAELLCSLCVFQPVESMALVTVRRAVNPFQPANRLFQPPLFARPAGSLCPLPLVQGQKQLYFFPYTGKVAVFEGDDVMPTIVGTRVKDGLVRVKSIAQ